LLSFLSFGTRLKEMPKEDSRRPRKIFVEDGGGPQKYFGQRSRRPRKMHFQLEGKYLK
jgi:hypothetical protein